VRLAAALAARGETDAAIAAYREAIALSFEPASVWLALGKLLLDQMTVDEALDAYERAVDLDSKAIEAIGSFALSSLAARDADRTRALLEGHEAAHPDSVDALYALGTLDLRQGHAAAAEGRLRRVLELDPRHTQAHYNLAQLLLRSGRASEGREEMGRFQELEAAESADWERHNKAHRLRLQARASIEASDPEAATEALETIVAEGTAELDDWLELGNAALAAGRPPRAFEWFARSVEAFPYNQKALEGLSRAATELGLPNKAREASQRLELLRGDCP
jgi:tetratricopeptide (TPR) repeat protein